MFDESKLLIDPYAKSIRGLDGYSRIEASNRGSVVNALKGEVLAPFEYNWENDVRPMVPYSKTVIYEMHVGGFTKNPNSGLEPELRGTFKGLIEKIPYLKELGITTVELMPVSLFDSQDAPHNLKNYWGYSPISFFAPHSPYSSSKDAITEFRDMVKALHKEGIEVILDVVFNHSAEGDLNGPTLSFRGLDNRTYYILDPKDSSYQNYSGCGNTLKAQHPVVGRLILDSLHWWVRHMHVDGFRFDLASVLSRDVFGSPLDRPPILWIIESDAVLAGTKLIAEAWDPAGLYQIGWFVNQGDWFSEWNGPFRDDVRKFIRGDEKMVPHIMARILGSSDIYLKTDRDPNRSIHFVTCHDGFTLNDLVTYDTKHNQQNKENNSDGTDLNFSWNCGVEGSSDDPAIESLRIRQIKNLLTMLFFSQGTPMIQMGDEVRRTTNGNNNAYCLDNELAWFNWDGLKEHPEIHRFVHKIIGFTQSLDVFGIDHDLALTAKENEPYIAWHGVRLNEPDTNDYSHSIAFELFEPQAKEHLYIAFNAYWKPLSFELPESKYRNKWHRLVDTHLDSPEDFTEIASAPAVPSQNYMVRARSSIVLLG